ncbi:MAG: arginine deiminase family protein [Chloroflexota bacterium]
MATDADGRFGARSEYGRLRAAVVASPIGFRPAEVINVTQARYFGSAPPRVDAMVREHQGFMDLLSSRGVRLHWADPLPCAPYQVNTRDVGVVVGDCFVRARMSRSIRAAEPDALPSSVGRLDGQRRSISDGHLEGGDILLDGSTVWVGLGERTDERGAAELQHLLGDAFRIRCLALAPGVLHLDVVLTLLPRGLALVYPPGVASGLDQVLHEREPIEVSHDEADRLGTNVLCLDERTIVVEASQLRITRTLEQKGLDVVTLPYSEIGKVGGSLRCTTLPLIRD